MLLTLLLLLLLLLLLTQITVNLNKVALRLCAVISGTKTCKIIEMPADPSNTGVLPEGAKRLQLAFGASFLTLPPHAWVGTAQVR